MVTDLGVAYANRKLIRNFLLVINSNFVYAMSTRAPLRF